MNKLNSQRGGVSRLVAILLVLIAIMLVVIAIPAWKVFRYRSEKTGCDQAMKSAGDGLLIEYLNRQVPSTLDDNKEADELKAAMDTLDEVMVARPNICPAGGTVYLVKNKMEIYQPVCGLHEADRKLKVRLNASRAAELAAEALRIYRQDNHGENPESLEIELNGKPLTCVLVQERQPLTRGTRLTNGFEGIVAFFGLNGEGSFHMEEVEPGAICYFVYADEDHCASWRADDGWTGDAYKDVEGAVK